MTLIYMLQLIICNPTSSMGSQDSKQKSQQKLIEQIYSVQQQLKKKNHHSHSKASENQQCLIKYLQDQKIEKNFDYVIDKFLEDIISHCHICIIYGILLKQIEKILKIMKDEKISSKDKRKYIKQPLEMLLAFKNQKGFQFIKQFQKYIPAKYQWEQKEMTQEIRESLDPNQKISKESKKQYLKKFFSNYRNVSKKNKQNRIEDMYGLKGQSPNRYNENNNGHVDM